MVKQRTPWDVHAVLLAFSSSELQKKLQTGGEGPPGDKLLEEGQSWGQDKGDSDIMVWTAGRVGLPAWGSVRRPELVSHRLRELDSLTSRATAPSREEGAQTSLGGWVGAGLPLLSSFQGS